MELPTAEAWSCTRGKDSVNHFKLGDNKLYPFLCDAITGYWVEGRESIYRDSGFLHLFGVVTSTIVFQGPGFTGKTQSVFCLNKRKNKRLTVNKGRVKKQKKSLEFSTL